MRWTWQWDVWSIARFPRGMSGRCIVERSVSNELGHDWLSQTFHHGDTIQERANAFWSTNQAMHNVYVFWSMNLLIRCWLSGHGLRLHPQMYQIFLLKNRVESFGMFTKLVDITWYIGWSTTWRLRWRQKVIWRCKCHILITTIVYFPWLIINEIMFCIRFTVEVV